jgi:L-lysine 2,3-aminomutase
MDGGVTLQCPLYWFCLVQLFSRSFFDNLDSATTKIWISRALYVREDKEVHGLIESGGDRFLLLRRLSEFCIERFSKK